MSNLRRRFAEIRDHLFLAGVPGRCARLEASMDDLREQVARLVLSEDRESGELDLRVFSQWGEDGILHSIVTRLPGIPKSFVELGVEDYRECNTRFLARGGWSGLAVDGDVAAITRAGSLREVWGGNVKAIAEWIEPENIDQIITRAGLEGEIGVLSIDLDGIDLYVLEAISVVRPWVIVIEYNARFGPTAAVTVPYARNFDRREAHSSWLYHGVSLAGVEAWGLARGYDLVTVNREGTNAFLTDGSHRVDGMPAKAASDLWRPLRFSEHRDVHGNRVPVSFEEEQRIVSTLPSVEVREMLNPAKHVSVVGSPSGT